MSYGVQLFNSAGALTFDSNTAQGGVVADVIRPPFSGGAYPSVTRTYPAFAGRTAQAVTLDGSQVFGSTVDYALGYPRVITALTYWPASILVLIQ